MKYTLTLSNGQIITDLILNGTNFVSEKKIDESIFDGNLSSMTVSDGETEYTMMNVELIQQVEYEGNWYLAFRELTKAELREMEIDAKLEYIAMMADIDMGV